MLEIDNPPLMLFLIVLFALIAPQIYSFYVDKYVDKVGRKNEKKQ